MDITKSIIQSLQSIENAVAETQKSETATIVQASLEPIGAKCVTRAQEKRFSQDMYEDIMGFVTGSLGHRAHKLRIYLFTRKIIDEEGKIVLEVLCVPQKMIAQAANFESNASDDRFNQKPDQYQAEIIPLKD